MSTIDEKLEMKLSAWCDGELDSAAGVEIERLIAEHPECAATVARYRKLDSGAAALPVPAASGELYSPMELERALRQPIPAKLQASIAAAPLIATERFAKVWAAIQARVENPSAAHDVFSAMTQQKSSVPVINAQKWDRVWSGIRSGVAAHTKQSDMADLPCRKASGAVAAVHSGRVVRTTRWRWFSAAGIAAMLVGALAIHFFYKQAIPADNTVAIDLPNTSDNERYEISVEYSVHGDAVVCYYLKPEERANDTEHNWRWLPD